MSLRSLGVLGLLISLQITGIKCDFSVRPEDLVVHVGSSVSFNCSTNSSSSTRRGTRWIYTAEKNFRRPSHIYEDGRLFPKWETRHTVTESTDHNESVCKSTLTISSVNSNDVGFYTCMALSDDSKATAHLNLLTDETRQNQGKVKMSGRFPSFIELSQEPYSDHIRNITIRINQGVNLTANAKDDDVVSWLFSPANNSSEYFTLYDSGKYREKDGCSGYDFRNDHTIFIARAKPCHAGTYTCTVVIADNGGPRSIVVIVNDTEEVTTTMAKSGSILDPSSTPAPDGYSQRVWPVYTCITLAAVIATGIIIGVLRRKGRCENMPCTRRINNDGTRYPPEDSTEQTQRYLNG